MATLESIPPGVRWAAAREVMVAHQAKGQVGYPPSIATDAQLGFSVLAYQSAAVLFGLRKGIPAFPLDSKAHADGPILGGGVYWPSEPKWDGVCAARGPPTSRYPGDTRQGDFQRERPIDFRGGPNVIPGLQGAMPRAFILSAGALSRITGSGRPNRSKSRLLPSLAS